MAELCLVEHGQEEDEFLFSTRPSSPFQDDNLLQEEAKDHRVNEEKEDEERQKPSESLLENGISDGNEYDYQDEDEDGYKTPTSLDHNILEVKQCPPAPRKLKPNRSVKRKLLVSGNECLNSQPDLTLEIELFFEDLSRNIKKAREEAETDR